MNKKQLAMLVQAAVVAVMNVMNANGDDVTEDETRTLVALKLRKQIRSVIADCADCEPDEAAKAHKEALAELEAVVAGKKAAKKAEADADEEDDDEDS